MPDNGGRDRKDVMDILILEMVLFAVIRHLFPIGRGDYTQKE